MNGNKFTSGQILRKPVKVVKGRILAGWAQKSSEPCCGPQRGHALGSAGWLVWAPLRRLGRPDKPGIGWGDVLESGQGWKMSAPGGCQNMGGEPGRSRSRAGRQGRIISQDFRYMDPLLEDH
jgi:hypothetical protein